MILRRAVALVARVVALLVLAAAPVVSAAESASTNYSVDRVFFGAGGELNACSTSYCAKQTAGEIAAGNIAGSAFRASAGFNVEREPYIAFSVAGGTTDLGYLSQAATSTTTATFAIKTYLANGYVVQLASDPPTNLSPGNHILTNLTSPTSSSVGVEQFGINLVHNTSPASLNASSADPVQVPDNTFSFGSVSAGYNTANTYKYVKGDTIATSSQSTGETDFTISFIYNISNITPDGVYRYDGVLVATSTY